MGPALSPGAVGQEMAACAVLGGVLGAARAVLPTRGRAAFLPDMLFVGYDAELLALTSHAFRVYALNFFLMGFNVYGSSFFTALGDGVTSALISFLRTLLFQLLALIFLPMVLGIEGVRLP